LIRPRHLRLPDQHRDDPLALLQRRFNLETYKITRIVEPAQTVLITRVNPTLADDSSRFRAF
jgi:hypothetical protein